MTNLDKIRARLEALKAKTVDNGCTEAEALAAAEMMAQLLARHGLTEDDLAAPLYCETTIGIGRRSPLDRVWFTVAAFADCRGWYVRAGRGWAFTFFGRDGDVLVAEYIQDVLRRACDQALADFRKSSPVYLRRRQANTRSQAVKAFQEGLAAGLVLKLHNGLWRRYGGHASTSRANDLIKANQDHLAAIQAAKGAKFRPARALATTDGAFKRAAQADGQRAAGNINVNAGVAAGNKVAGVLS